MKEYLFSLQEELKATEFFSSSLQAAAGGADPTGGRRRVRKKPMEEGKPAYSYISLICMAIASSPQKQATLKVCYNIFSRGKLLTRNTT